MSRAAPEPKANMGKPEPRVDGRLKVTGEARYGSDFPVSNPTFAYLVTSSIAKGEITGMDLSDAKAVPGVLDIFTHENTGKLKNLKFGAGGGGPTTSIQDFGPKIQHDGQIVAMVVADSFEAAREAAYKVKVAYTAEKPSATFDSPGVKMCIRDSRQIGKNSPSLRHVDKAACDNGRGLLALDSLSLIHIS